MVFRPPHAEAIEALARWVSWARRCRIPAFVALRRKILRHREAILAAIDEATGLTVLSCVPASGTSSLLTAAAEDARHPCLLVDASRCRDSLDLGMAIADAAVRVLAQVGVEGLGDVGVPRLGDGFDAQRLLEDRHLPVNGRVDVTHAGELARLQLCDRAQLPGDGLRAQ